MITQLASLEALVRDYSYLTPPVPSIGLSHSRPALSHSFRVRFGPIATIRARKNADGTRSYQVRYVAPDGRRLAQSFRKKVDAERFLVTMEADKVKGTWIDPAGGRTLFEDWVATWQGRTVNLRPSSRARVESALKVH